MNDKSPLFTQLWLLFGIFPNRITTFDSSGWASGLCHIHATYDPDIYNQIVITTTTIMVISNHDIKTSL